MKTSHLRHVRYDLFAPRSAIGPEPWRLGNKRGISLVITLLIMSLFLILTALTIMYVAGNVRHSGTYKASQKAFQVAEAGLEEARARLCLASGHQINDTATGSALWQAFLGTPARSQEQGYDSTNTLQVRYDSLQSDLDYVVKIAHQTDSAGNVLYWGDTNGDGVYERTTAAAGNRNIYLATSYGYADKSVKILVAELTGIPPIKTPAALYVNAPATIQGSSSYISGNDSCGANNLQGIVTSQAISTVTLNGNPTIEGAGGTTPNIAHTDTVLDLQALINSLKMAADKKYIVESATQTAATAPGPGDGWGIPVPGASTSAPSSCSAHHIVHYQANGSGIHFSGGVSGCGLLLVEGNLHLTGGFTWYGIVISTGSVSFTGGGDKNITGAVLAGGSADADLVGGNAHIGYCSSAVNNQFDNMPLRYLSWKEK